MHLDSSSRANNITQRKTELNQGLPHHEDTPGPLLHLEQFEPSDPSSFLRAFHLTIILTGNTKKYKRNAIIRGNGRWLKTENVHNIYLLTSLNGPLQGWTMLFVPKSLRELLRFDSFPMTSHFKKQCFWTGLDTNQIQKAFQFKHKLVKLTIN